MLKKELVQVQTLMDNMTREREEESERLKSQYEELQANFTTSEVSHCLRGELMLQIRQLKLAVTLSTLYSSRKDGVTVPCCFAL